MKIWDSVYIYKFFFPQGRTSEKVQEKKKFLFLNIEKFWANIKRSKVKKESANIPYHPQQQQQQNQQQQLRGQRNFKMIEKMKKINYRILNYQKQGCQNGYHQL